MPQQENWLSDEDRRAALEILAARLGKDIPEAVADNLPEDLLSAAYFGDEEEHWRDVEDYALRLLDAHHHAPGTSVPPGRDAERGAPEKIAVKLPEHVTKRAEVLAEVAATICTNYPEVRRFRRKILGGRLLTNEEARAFLDERGGPYGTNRAARKNTKARKRLLEGTEGPFRTPVEMKQLLRLAEKLSNYYPWEEGDALWFVLTGHAPPVRPLEVTISMPLFATPGSHVPSTARITITAQAWVKAEHAERAFRDAQRQVLGGDPSSPRDERTLEVVKFVARRIREHGKESWEQRRKAWNETCRKGWRYKTYRSFGQVYKRFAEQYVYRDYNQPNFDLRERTPYNMYRDDWNDRITGRKEKRARRLASGGEIHQ
jgi:hypothetical protein